MGKRHGKSRHIRYASEKPLTAFKNCLNASIRYSFNDSRFVELSTRVAPSLRLLQNSILCPAGCSFSFAAVGLPSTNLLVAVLRAADASCFDVRGSKPSSLANASPFVAQAVTAVVKNSTVNATSAYSSSLPNNKLDTTMFTAFSPQTSASPLYASAKCQLADSSHYRVNYSEPKMIESTSQICCRFIYYFSTLKPMLRYSVLYFYSGT